MNVAPAVDAELHAGVEHGVATIWLDRAAKRNALTLDHWRRLAGVVADVGEDRTVRVVVLRSTNVEVFCAGADIDEFTSQRADLASAAAYTAVLEAGVAALAGCRRPTIAVVQGKCLGGGLELVQACDIVIADASARFGLSPASLGTVYPYEATRRLLATWGVRQARFMLSTGSQVTGLRAHELGVVAELCDAATIGTRVAAVAEQVAALSPIALAGMKQIVTFVASGRPDAAAVASDWIAAALDSLDYSEGLAAFREKRRPKFE